MNEKPLVPFKGTIVQEEQLKKVIAEHREQKGGLMPVLQQAQEIYGYLPYEVQAMIAEGLGISLSEVFGVATFYSQFRFNAVGKYLIMVCKGTACYVNGAERIIDAISEELGIGKNKISVCLGTACYVKGSDKVLEAIESRLGIKSGECTEDGLFSIDACRCVGACGLAPVMLVGEDVYGKVLPEQVPGILNSYKEAEGGANN